MWDPVEYSKFSDERSRPFWDLVERIPQRAFREIVDLGCGQGRLTSQLQTRWPQARIVGVDNSTAMLEQARPLCVPGRLEFLQADIADWRPETAPDLILSNAALHWIDDHASLLHRLTAMLAHNGVLAVQMPNRFRTRSQRALEQTVANPRWKDALQGVGLNRHSVRPITWYCRRLRALNFNVDAWKTTYVHVLSGEDPVLKWLSGTALRPLLAKLDTHDAKDFLAELAGRLRTLYPPTGDVTLFPMPRLFFVACPLQRLMKKPLQE